MGAVTFRSRVGSALGSDTGLVRGATVPGCVLQPPVPGLVGRDLRMVAGRIAEIGTDLPGEGVDLDGGTVLPGFDTTLPDYRELNELFARCQTGSSRS